jgi:hypothetical protein
MKDVLGYADRIRKRAHNATKVSTQLNYPY